MPHHKHVAVSTHLPSGLDSKHSESKHSECPHSGVRVRQITTPIAPDFDLFPKDAVRKYLRGYEQKCNPSHLLQWDISDPSAPEGRLFNLYKAANELVRVTQQKSWSNIDMHLEAFANSIKKAYPDYGKNGGYDQYGRHGKRGQYGQSSTAMRASRSTQQIQVKKALPFEIQVIVALMVYVSSNARQKTISTAPERYESRKTSTWDDLTSECKDVRHVVHTMGELIAGKPSQSDGSRQLSRSDHSKLTWQVILGMYRLNPSIRPILDEVIPTEFPVEESSTDSSQTESDHEGQESKAEDCASQSAVEDGWNSQLKKWLMSSAQNWDAFETHSGGVFKSGRGPGGLIRPTTGVCEAFIKSRFNSPNRSNQRLKTMPSSPPLQSVEWTTPLVERNAEQEQAWILGDNTPFNPFKDALKWDQAFQDKIKSARQLIRKPTRTSIPAPSPNIDRAFLAEVVKQERLLIGLIAEWDHKRDPRRVPIFPLNPETLAPGRVSTDLLSTSLSRALTLHDECQPISDTLNVKPLFLSALINHTLCRFNEKVNLQPSNLGRDGDSAEDPDFAKFAYWLMALYNAYQPKVPLFNNSVDPYIATLTTADTTAGEPIAVDTANHDASDRPVVSAPDVPDVHNTCDMQGILQLYRILLNGNLASQVLRKSILNVLNSYPAPITLSMLKLMVVHLISLIQRNGASSIRVSVPQAPPKAETGMDAKAFIAAVIEHINSIETRPKESLAAAGSSSEVVDHSCSYPRIRSRAKRTDPLAPFLSRYKEVVKQFKN